LCLVRETLPGGSVAYTRQGIDGADGGFLYPSGNTSSVMRASAKRPPLRIIVDALQ
jgi:hypothetical protein